MKNKLTFLTLLMLFISSMSLAQITVPTVTAPLQNAVGVSILPTFSWSGGVSYVIEVSTSPTSWIAPDLVYTSTVPVPTNLTIPETSKLSNGTTYYWHAVAGTGTGTFTTVSAAMPYLASPSNGAIISGTSTTFSWNSGVAGIKYFLQYTLASDPTFVACTEISTTNTYSTVNNTVFAVGGNYIWRVISKNLAGTVVFNYSNTWQFSVPGLPTPYASYPTGNTTIYNNPPTLYWYLESYNSEATEYHVKYSKTGPGGYSYVLGHYDATEGYFTTSSINQYITIPFALTAGARYYWEVASSDGTHESAFSTEESFTVYGSATFLICYPSYPSGGVTVATQPTFYWYSNVYAPSLYYLLQISTDPAFGSTVVNHTTNITTNSYTVTSGEVTTWAPVAGNTYYWRVKGSLDGTTYGPWSAGANFVYPTSSSTAASVATPYPATPASGSIVSVTNPTLSWYAYSSDPIQFQVIYSTDPTLSSGVLANILIGGVMTASSGAGVLSSRPLINSTSFVLSGLTPGATYYWQVRAKSVTSGSYGAWSTLSYFTTAPGAASVVPIAGSPINGTPINNTNATLSWILPAKSASTLTYDVQYSKTADFSNEVTTAGNVDKASVDVNNLDKNAVYYWRVASKTGNGDVSSYSAPTSFNTGAITSVEEKETLPATFELSQNYPNPFNPTTIINFALPKNSFVTLKVYDMLGREVKTLIDREISAGVHSFNWNAENNSGQKVTSGVYIYRISAGEFTAVKKMVLIK